MWMPGLSEFKGESHRCHPHDASHPAELLTVGRIDNWKRIRKPDASGALDIE
jgi:hypothetical protein